MTISAFKLENILIKHTNIIENVENKGNIEMKGKIQHIKSWRISAVWLIICTFTFVGCAPSAVRTGNKPIKKTSSAKVQKQEIPINDKIAEFEKKNNVQRSESSSQNRILPSLEEQLTAISNEQITMKNQIANLQKDVDELRYTLDEIKGSLEQSNVVGKRSAVAGIPVSSEQSAETKQHRASNASNSNILLSDEEAGKNYIQQTQKSASLSTQKASNSINTNSISNQAVQKSSSIIQKSTARAVEKTQSKVNEGNHQENTEKVDMTQSLTLMSQRQFDKAIDELEKVANNTKNETIRNEAKYLLAENHSQLGNYEQAAEIYTELLKKGSGEKTAEIAIKLADCKIKLGRIAEAKNTYREIIEKYPRSEYVPKARKMLQQM